MTGTPGRSRRIEWVAALFLASGAALVVYIVSGISLRWTFASLGVAAVALGSVAVHRMAPPRRARLARRVVTGVAAGLVATLAYDVTRYALVELAGMAVKPFEAWRLFGLALAGTGRSAGVVFAAGMAFHLCNGLAFGVAYTVAFGHRGPLGGVVWALALEAVMVSVYPGWLGLRALDEFIQVTVAGHVVYGAVLGWLSRALLRRHRWGEDDRNGKHATGDAVADPAAV